MDIDSISTEISQEMALESLEKTMPPKLAYRWRKWMQTMRGKTKQSGIGMHKFEQIVLEKAAEVTKQKPLAKNEARVSTFEHGVIKMEFGSDVPQQAKDAAMRWAKKRGLNVVEASLNKSGIHNTSIVFASTLEHTAPSSLLQSATWSIE